MKLLIDAGHGFSWRTPQVFDCGLLNENGDSEAAIARQYMGMLRNLSKEYLGQTAITTESGTLFYRLQKICRTNCDLVITFHMHLDTSGAPGRKITYATRASLPIAETLGARLNATVEQAPCEGLLQYTPSIEIQLGNIASWQDMKSLASTERAEEICRSILSTLAQLYAPAPDSSGPAD